MELFQSSSAQLRLLAPRDALGPSAKEGGGGKLKMWRICLLQAFQTSKMLVRRFVMWPLIWSSCTSCPKPNDPRLEAMKEACTPLHLEPAFDENRQEYIIGDFHRSTKKIVNVSSMQVYRGQADQDVKAHGWGLMQHHNRISHDCAHGSTV